MGNDEVDKNTLYPSELDNHSSTLINNIDVFKTIISIVHRFKKKKHEKNKQINNTKQTNYISNDYIKMQKKYDIT